MDLEKNFFAKTKLRLFLVITLFAMSYLIRSTWDFFLVDRPYYFAYFLAADLVYLVSDGFTFLALLIFHRNSFL